MKYLVLFSFMIPMLGLTQTWVNRTFSNLYDVQARSMVEMGNGNFLVTGTQAFSNGFLSVHNTTGTCTATYFLSQSALSSYSDFNQIVKMNDTMAVIGGKISLAGGPIELWKGITVAVNDQGSVLWTLTHEVSSPMEDVVVKDIERYNDSVLFVLSSSIGTSRNALSKIDRMGNLAWSKNFDANNESFQLNDLCWIDSNLFVCGTLNESGSISGVVLKLDNSGNLIEGFKYSYNNFPDFVQVIKQGMHLVLANCGPSSDQTLIKMDFSGNIVDQKSYPMMAQMPEDQALKPLSVIDSSHFWFFHGGHFGSMGYQIEGTNMLPYNVVNHVGNLQTVLQQDTSIKWLSSGPIYGIKSQLVLQKHYAITSADSLDALYAFCTYPSNEPPTNQLVPVRVNFSPTLSQGNTPNPLNYPFLNNEAWTDEPLCVEMLGGTEESTLMLGPNPCDEVLKIEVQAPLEYSILNLGGRIVQSGQTNPLGHIDTRALPNGLYLFMLANRTYRIQVMHGG